MEGRWCSAAQVAADLTRAGGGGAPPAPRALADACLPWDARPAPITRTEREHEWDGERTAAERLGPPPSPPDLQGITRMLRMMETVDTDEEPSALYGNGGGMFISRPPAPRLPPHSSPGARTHLATHHANGTDATSVNTSNLNPNVAEFVPRSMPPARGGSGAGREESAARLREDICGGRDKCSAIARLMRLYAEEEEEEEPTPRLLTPEYFERPPAPDRHYNTSRTVEQPHEAADVRLSLDKVRRWLGGGEGSPRPAPPRPCTADLLLTPVTFRARAPPPARLPPPRPHPACVTPAYVPPPGAMEALQREYAARIAAAAAAQPTAAAGDTLWTRLEPQLRQKEAERRARDARAADP